MFFRKLAEIAGEYLRKGSQVYVEGRLQTRKWQDQSGADRYTTEIVADQMQMLGGRGGGAGMDAPSTDQGYGASSGSGQSSPQPAAAAEDFDDDIPF